MTELIHNAWLGWGRFIQDGKIIALFLAALLFLLMRSQKAARSSFALYAAVMAAGCMAPVTAAVLMLYQTRFYDYEWIWSLVPLTALTAYGLAEFLAEYWKDFKGSLWKKGLPVTLLLLGALCLCGGLGKTVWNRREEARERQYVQTVLKELRNRCGDGQICLWAPENVMEYARELDGGICLVYGRNMWDLALNAYAYDIYEPAVTELYHWMGQSGEEFPSGEGYEEGRAVVRRCAETVRSMGVNCILMPGNAAQDKLAELEAALEVQAVRMEGYYLLKF